MAVAPAVGVVGGIGVLAWAMDMTVRLIKASQGLDTGDGLVFPPGYFEERAAAIKRKLSGNEEKPIKIKNSVLSKKSSNRWWLMGVRESRAPFRRWYGRKKKVYRKKKAFYKRKKTF